MTQAEQINAALPAKARAFLYIFWALGSLTLGAFQVGYSAADQAQPTWVIVAIAVWAFVGGGLGLTAATNVNVGPPVALPPDVIAEMSDDEDAKARFQLAVLPATDDAALVASARRPLHDPTDDEPSD